MGEDERIQVGMYIYLPSEQRSSLEDPLRAARMLANAVPRTLGPACDRLSSRSRFPSVPSQHILHATFEDDPLGAPGAAAG